MFRMFMISLASIGLFVLGASAQEVKKGDDKGLDPLLPKDSGKTGPGIKTAAEVGVPGDVEVHFLNGSTVRMLLQSDKMDIATPYGQLAIPVKDILAIDFGLHFPEGYEAKIKQAIKDLDSDQFKDRAQASKVLIELGPYSYPAVFEASRAADLERSRRGKELLKQLQAKHPKKDLKNSTDDRVVTPNFTIVGRILTTSVKAKAELFGDVSLPVARMRTMRSLAGSGLDIEVVVDAGKYANQGQWMETDFQVDGRSTISVTAKGLVDSWPQQGGQYMHGPNGLQGRGFGMNIVVPAGRKINGPIQGQTYAGMLLGKIGEDGEPFTIGERYEGAPDAQGKLYLHIGPSPWNAQSSGSFEVKIGRKQGT
jgi:hypothetical protein